MGRDKKQLYAIQNNTLGIAKISPCFENRKSVLFENLINGYGTATKEIIALKTIFPKKHLSISFYIYLKVNISSLLKRKEWQVQQAKRE